MRLGNLYCIVDSNAFQQTGSTMGISGNQELGSTFQSFGWLLEYADGHDTRQLRDSLSRLKNHSRSESTPKVVIARTIKGKGLPAFEGSNAAHHISLTKEKFHAAMNLLAMESSQDLTERHSFE